MHKIKQIIIASSNQGKVKEFQNIIEANHELKIQSEKLIFRTIAEIYSGDFNPEETGSSFSENALIKAKAAAEILRTQSLESDSLILSDDSGIEIEALNGRPGIYSARYLKKHGIEGILKELGSNPNRQARFVCHLTLVNLNGQIVFETEEYWHGTITQSPRGTNGFGYDPIVTPQEYENQTVAELDDSIKSRISHRAKAFIKISRLLKLA